MTMLSKSFGLKQIALIYKKNAPEGMEHFYMTKLNLVN